MTGCVLARVGRYRTWVTTESRDLGNSSPSFAGAACSSFPSAEGVEDAAFVFNKPSQPNGSEVDIEEAVVDLFEADIVASQEAADGHAVRVPADASVGADEASFKMTRIGDEFQGLGKRSG